jgi:hypothetical protein
MEEFRYTDDGQPLATTLADYVVPTAPRSDILACRSWLELVS